MKHSKEAEALADLIEANPRIKIDIDNDCWYINREPNKWKNKPDALIAEYMGEKWRIEDAFGEVEPFVQIDDGFWIVPNYISDWNVLMKVFDKINQNPKEIEISIAHSGVFVIYPNEGDISKFLTQHHPLIECLYIGIVEAITYSLHGLKTNNT